MKQVILTLATLAVLGLVGAAAVVGLGLYNVSARVGHLPGVSWVLHTTFRNAVDLRAERPERMPDLADPALIALGAKHYETACLPCHAEPGRERTATMSAMVPEPPHIDEAVGDWTPAELHWIVYNGVKMSGMPHWPAERREEEVWSVVAYLEAVQQGIEPQAQQALTADPQVEGPEHAAWCASCHGGVERHVPRLDILTEPQIAEALEEYRSGARPSGIMQQAASIPTEAELKELAAWFGDRQPRGAGSGGGGAAERGAVLAQRGTEEVPACTACHGPGATEPNPHFPSLAGQDRAYLATQLRLWRDGTRHGSALMTKAARALEDDQIAELAAWFASLPPQKGTGAPVTAEE